MKRCTQCAELIQSEAVKCRYCGFAQKAAPLPAKYMSTRRIGLIMIGAALGAGLVVGRILYSSAGGGGAVAPAQSKVASHRPCLRTGSVDRAIKLEARLKQELRNPASYEHVATQVAPPANGQFPVVITYRATNGFGAIDTQVARGEVRESDCAVRLIALE